MSHTAPPTDLAPLYTSKDVCGVIRQSRNWLSRKVGDETFPKPDYVIGRKHLWRRETLRKWMQLQECK